MELIRNGSLNQLLIQRQKEGNPLSDDECALIMKHLFLAVKYLHDNNFVHRDLKPGIKTNILIIIKPKKK